MPEFSPLVRQWFSAQFPGPTPVQEQTWAALGQGKHVLAISPTGSGKTLAAFLYFIDQLLHRDAPITKGVRVLYVSPLKALGVDVERNLNIPLMALQDLAGRRDQEVRLPRVAVRSGDTAPSERQRILRNPPEILITTPESLHLMLSSQAAKVLKTVEAVVIDEVHSLVGNKRGAHFALSLQRLAQLTEQPFRRVALSATVANPQVVADFVSPEQAALVVQPKVAKRFDLSVEYPGGEQMALNAADSQSESEPVSAYWAWVEKRLLQIVAEHDSTLIFTNSRGLSERLTARLNDRSGLSDFAHSHHGSLSREQRSQVEAGLKAGHLKCVVATSSLELGIDMGSVGVVVQLGCPPSVASALQRLGRAGHQVGQVSKGIFIAKTQLDLLAITALLEQLKAGELEPVTLIENPLDVLAQHTVSASLLGNLEVLSWFDLVRTAAPFKSLPKQVYLEVLEFLSGRYPSEQFSQLKPKLIWNRKTNELSPAKGARQLVYTNSGTIPDRGLFGVFLSADATSSQVVAGAGRVGELDEEMVYESRVGEVFSLGSGSWRIDQITRDRVLVSPGKPGSGKAPFWHGDEVGREASFGLAIGVLSRQLAEMGIPERERFTTDLGLNAGARQALNDLFATQNASSTEMVSDRCLVVEQVRDQVGDWQVMLLSPFGKRVHGPWAQAVSQHLAEFSRAAEVSVQASDNGIVVRFADLNGPPPGAEIFQLNPKTFVAAVQKSLPDSALFATIFRQCSARALLLPRMSVLQRMPLWQQRLRSAQLLTVALEFPRFPMLVEAGRECLQNIYDIQAAVSILSQLANGDIRLLQSAPVVPSPYAQDLLFGYVGQYMYLLDQPMSQRQSLVLGISHELLVSLLGQNPYEDLLDDAALSELAEQLRWQGFDRDRDAKALGLEAFREVLRIFGPLPASELRRLGFSVESITDAAASLGDSLEGWSAERLGQMWFGLEPNPFEVCSGWSPQETPAQPALELLATFAAWNLVFTSAQVAEFYGLPLGQVEATLEALEVASRVVSGKFYRVLESKTSEGVVEHGQVQWISRRNLEEAKAASQRVALARTKTVTGAQYVNYLLEQHFLPQQSLLEVLNRVAGFALPLDLVEQEIFATRVAGYVPGDLDELLHRGEVFWKLTKSGDSGAHFVTFYLEKPRFYGSELPAVCQEKLAELSASGAYLASEISAGDLELFWELVYAGALSADSFAPLRQLLQVSRGAGSARGSARLQTQGRRPQSLRRFQVRSHALVPNENDFSGGNRNGERVLGRWFVNTDASGCSRSERNTLQVVDVVESVLNCFELCTKGLTASFEVPGGYQSLQPVLTELVAAGQCLRGYFVSGLGGSQFAIKENVDWLQEHAGKEKPTPQMRILHSQDLAQPYGSFLPWPTGHGFRRKPNAYVAICDGELVGYLETKSAKLWVHPDADTGSLAQALERLVASKRVRELSINTINAVAAYRSEMATALQSAGFSATVRGFKRYQR